MKQLVLPFLAAAGYAASDFCAAASNAAAREVLAHPARWTNGRLVLWGDADCGKTHLLHIWTETHGADLLDGPALRDMLYPARPAAVDDADCAPPEGLLHLLNAMAEARHPVLLAARLPPARQALDLADLRSRLLASDTVEILPAEDALLDMLLTRLAAARQLDLSHGVRNYLLTYLPRTPAALREAVARLDRAAMDRGGKITRALAAGVLEA